MIGLKRGSVCLADHQKEWEIEAKKTISLLKSILGDSAEDIQHIGSTAITQIKAKPIIDIAVFMRAEATMTAPVTSRRTSFMW